MADLASTMSFTIILAPSLDYGYSSPVEVTAVAAEGITVEITYLKDGKEAEITLTDANVVKNFYILTFDAIQKSPIIAASGQQVDVNNTNYAVNVLNPGDYEGTSTLRSAADYNQWIMPRSVSGH